MSLIDKDKAVNAIAMYLFINDAIKSTEPMKVADYEVFARSILTDVPEVDAIPRDYYEKVVGELCRKHTEEIASMPDIVRCKECRHWIGETEHYEDREYKACWQLCGQYMDSEFWCKYGEREGE